MISWGVTMWSTVKSCSSWGSGSSMTWSWCTVVAMIVAGPMSPASASSPTSMSE
jgi:hypothetical protein